MIVFLDRDGVINEFPGMGNYVTSWEVFRFLPNSIKAIALLTKLGCELDVISNQGCVARGFITREELKRLTDNMLKQIEKKKGKVNAVYYCYHQTSDNCECKKPKIKLFLDALGGRKVDLSETYFIGDTQEDMMAGKTLGCRTILVLSGKTKAEDLKNFEPKPDLVKTDLWAAAQWIEQNKS